MRIATAREYARRAKTRKKRFRVCGPKFGGSRKRCINCGIKLTASEKKRGLIVCPACHAKSERKVSFEALLTGSWTEAVVDAAIRKEMRSGRW